METVKITKQKAKTTVTAENLLSKQFWLNQGRSETSASRKAAQSVTFTLDAGQVINQSAKAAPGTMGGVYTSGANLPFSANGLDAVSLRNIAKTAARLADVLEGVE